MEKVPLGTFVGTPSRGAITLIDEAQTKAKETSESRANPEHNSVN
jgi:hypothetical protein